MKRNNLTTKLINKLYKMLQCESYKDLAEKMEISASSISRYMHEDHDMSIAVLEPALEKFNLELILKRKDDHAQIDLAEYVDLNQKYHLYKEMFEYACQELSKKTEMMHMMDYRFGQHTARQFEEEIREEIEHYARHHR